MPKMIVARGPRAVEHALLAEIDQIQSAADCSLDHPLRIVVPSSALRLHLCRRLARRGPVVGVVVQTLSACMLEILDTAGLQSTRGSRSYEILIRRHARRQRTLRNGLDHLEDGYRAVLATIRDLFDAGFELEHFEPLADQLEDIGTLPPTLVERAQAILCVARDTATDARALGISRLSDLLRMAIDVMIATSGSVLPTKALIVHGFSDVTGVAGDLIEALLRHTESTVVLDQPTEATAGDFSEVLFERLSGLCHPIEMTDPPYHEPPLRCCAAVNPAAEVRSALIEIKDSLETGAPPESLALVARDLSIYATHIRRHADRLGIPITAVGEQIGGGRDQRRARAVVALLERGPDTPVEIWAEAVNLEEFPLADLHLWLRLQGITQLRDLATLSWTQDDDQDLPIVEGFSRQGRIRRRTVAADAITNLIAAAAASMHTLESWPSSASAAEHLDASLDLIGATSAEDPIVQALQELAIDLIANLELSQDEWLILLRRELEGLGHIPLAPATGGIRILNVMEARAHTFEGLFLLGMNRDVFPRVVREDPLLPDAVRTRLVPILPDIPIKERGWAEERHLYAQLLLSAKHIRLSWSISDDSRPLSPSPFVESTSDSAEPAPDLWNTSCARCRPAFESAVLAGLEGSREQAAEALGCALDEAQTRFETPRLGSSTDIATARLSIVDAIDPTRPRDDLGPYTGCIGVIRPGDPRRRRMSVTLLESIARCPWQALLTRVLGIDSAPDFGLQLPQADPRLVGMTIHATLQAIVDLHPGAEGESRPVPWPDPEQLESIIQTQATTIARSAGVERAGLVPILVEKARKPLDNARIADWNDPTAPPEVIGAEVDASCSVNSIRLHYRADRVDRRSESLVYTDYKNSYWKTTPKGLLTDISRGTMLQAAAYAFGDSAAIGRYLYLKPVKDKKCPADVEVAHDDQAIRQAFIAAVTTIVEAWEIGALVPRVAEGGKDTDNQSCQYCPVSQACLRSDSGYRQRVLRWRHRPPGDSQLYRSAHALWWLGNLEQASPKAREGDDVN